MLEQDQVVESYDHYLAYDDLDDAKAVLNYIRERFDPEAELSLTSHLGHDHTITFTTDEEFTEEQAGALLQFVSPDAYDLNIAEEDDEEGEENDEGDEEENEFPAVFTKRERDLAAVSAEDEQTLEYIRRLERIASTAWVFYVKACDLPVILPREIYATASLPMVDLMEALTNELRAVDFMQ